MKPPIPRRSVTETELLEGVANGQLFGKVECDIRVPDKWPSYFQHPTMTPYEYFEEMCHLCYAPPTYRSTLPANTCKITCVGSSCPRNLVVCW